LSLSFAVVVAQGCGGSESDDPTGDPSAGGGSQDPAGSGATGSAGRAGSNAAGTGGGKAGSAGDPIADAGTPSARDRLPFDPANLGAMIHDHTGDLEDVTLFGNCMLDSAQGVGDCALQGGGFRYVTIDQPDADPPNDRIAVFIADNLVIRKVDAIFVGGPYPTAIVALGDMTIDGMINASEGAGSPTPGPGQGDDAMNESFEMFGARGAEFCGRYGTPELTPLLGGSSGGSSITAAGSVGAKGGRGGGALQLIAGGSISIAGSVHSAGGEGQSCSVNNGAGGSGSGGALLIEAPSVAISGKISVAGGEANAGSCDTPDEEGEAGGFGRVRIDSSSGQAEIDTAAAFIPELSDDCISQGKLLLR
jgi:hypothetical protein